jgi:hypothetical protein
VSKFKTVQSACVVSGWPGLGIWRPACLAMSAWCGGGGGDL